jgi:hypothetical protein
MYPVHQSPESEIYGVATFTHSSDSLQGKKSYHGLHWPGIAMLKVQITL